MTKYRAVLVALLLAVTTVFVSTGPASALASPSGFGIHGTPTKTAIGLQWKWSKKPDHYRIQASRSKTFKKKILSKRVARAGKKPKHGKQQFTVRSLKSGTRYYFRVRAEKKHKHSHWSPVRTAVTEAGWPDAMTNFRATPGPGVGQATFRWNSTGANIATFRIGLALYVFSFKGAKPASYRTFKIPAAAARESRGHYKWTLSAAQFASVGAKVSSGYFVYAQLAGINADHSITRAGKPMTSVMPRGMPANGGGTPITVAQYNIRSANLPKDTGDAAWSSRKVDVAQNIVDSDADIVTLDEDSPAAYGGSTQIASLLKEINNIAGHNSYAYNRENPFKMGATASGGTQGSRILFNQRLFQQVAADKCIDAAAPAGSTTSSCAFVPGNDDRWASYVHLELRSNPKVRFWVVAAHPYPKQGSAAAEKIRADEVKAVIAKMNTLNQRYDDPVILGMDSNTYQTYQPHPSLSRNALTGAGGYYDTAASYNVINRIGNYKYSTNNTKDYGVRAQRPISGIGLGNRLDVIATKGIAGANDFFIQRSSDKWPGSDHNLVWTKIELPK